jgi:hypothetical protein
LIVLIKESKTESLATVVKRLTPRFSAFVPGKTVSGNQVDPDRSLEETELSMDQILWKTVVSKDNSVHERYEIVHERGGVPSNS